MEHLNARNFSQAQKEFDYYISLNDRTMMGVALFGKGLLYQKMGKPKEAIREFTKAADNDFHPQVKVSDTAYLNIGFLFMKSKSYKAAIIAYSKAVNNNPNNGLAHYYLGLAYFRMGNYERAKKESDEAIRLGVTFRALSENLAKKGIKKDKKEPEV
jgi:tetratricopeptide (TPR) repeat protein